MLATQAKSQNHKPKISERQRWKILELWDQVCEDREWKTSDRAFRLKTFGEILGRPLDTLNDVERINECTKLMNELRAMLGVDLQAGKEAADQGINRCRVLVHGIINDLVPCLELYIKDGSSPDKIGALTNQAASTRDPVSAYMTAIMEDKNRWWKIDRPTRGIELSDLNESQLSQLRDTLNRALHKKRKAAGHTIHDMRTAARIPCHCSRCVSQVGRVSPLTAVTASGEAADNPF